MHRPGDQTHELFQTSLQAHRPIAGADRDGAVVAVDIASCFLDLLDTIRVQPISEQV